LSIFITNHDFVSRQPVQKRPVFGPSTGRRGIDLLICAKSAQQSANSERLAQTRCEPAMHRRGMAKIIPVQFRKSRLPRRLLNDGWWLETKPARPTVIFFPKPVVRKPKPNSKPKVPYLILVTSGK
jgi:hypothetical protein